MLLTAPMMPMIKNSLHLTKDEIWYSNMAAVGSTVGARVLIGPICDRYGPKTTMAGLMIICAFPVAAAGI